MVGNQTMNDNAFKTLTEEHMLEAERLKKAWFDHVLKSLEQLGKNVDKLSSELSSTKEDLYKQITEVKDLLHTEIKERRLETDADLEKLEARIEKKLDELNGSIKALTVTGIKEELTKDINRLGNKVTAIQAKMAVLASVAGIAAFTVFQLARWLLPIITKALTP